MKIKEAIEKAIEGGWNDMEFAFQCDPKKSTSPFAKIKSGRWCYPREIFLDPEFWKCLGKSLGWEKELGQETSALDRFNRTKWVREWHKLIDHLAEGKDIESYFDSI